MKIWFFLGFLILLIGIGVFEYSLPQKNKGIFLNKTPKKIDTVLRVARSYWPGQYWIEIADKKGWFKDAGLTVELIDTNPNFYGSLDDTVAGKIDVNNFPLFELIKFNIQGHNLVMVLNDDTSTGAEAIVARKGITTIADLKGKRLGVTADSNLEYIANIVLESNNIPISSVRKVDMPAEDAVKALLAGTVDAVVTFEPIVTEAIKKANGNKIFDTATIRGIAPSGQAFSKEFIANHPDAVQAFVSVWAKTTNYITENSTEAYGIIAQIYKKTDQEVADFTKTDSIVDVRDNVTAFSYAAGFESLHGTSREITRFLRLKGIAKTDLDSTSFLDGQFVQSLR